MFMSLWSPEGNLHENLRPDVARSLVVDKGWTFEHPSKVKPVFNNMFDGVELPEEPEVPEEFEDDDEGED